MVEPDNGLGDERCVFIVLVCCRDLAMRPLPLRPSAVPYTLHVSFSIMQGVCDHPRLLDLAEMALRGLADVPLIDLPLVCSDCGSKRFLIYVSGGQLSELRGHSVSPVAPTDEAQAADQEARRGRTSLAARPT